MLAKGPLRNDDHSLFGEDAMEDDTAPSGVAEWKWDSWNGSWIKDEIAIGIITVLTVLYQVQSAEATIHFTQGMRS